MRLSILASGFVGLLSLAGCTTSPFDATLTDHPDALSAGGSDKLFDLAVGSADATIALADVQLTFQPIGGTMTVLNFASTVDSDGDGAIGEGDRLTAIEPGPDLLNSGSAGQVFNIQLTEKTGGNTVTVHWEGSWSAR